MNEVLKEYLKERLEDLKKKIKLYDFAVDYSKEKIEEMAAKDESFKKLQDETKEIIEKYRTVTVELEKLLANG